MNAALHLPTVVVAEANRATERQATAVLRRKHLQVSPVRDRESLIAAVASLLPALVLLDYAFEKHVPELLETLREASPGSPVLMLVDESKAPRAAGVGGLGPADLLLKPYSAFELGYRVERCLAAGRLATSSALRAAAARGEIAFSPSSVRAASVPAPRGAATTTALRDPKSGRLDAKRVAEYLGVPLKQVSAALGESYKALHKTPSKVAVQDKLAPVERVVSLLAERLRDRGRVRAWLNTPHPDLGERTALGVVLEGRASTVSDMLEAAAAGLPG